MAMRINANTRLGAAMIEGMSRGHRGQRLKDFIVGFYANMAKARQTKSHCRFGTGRRVRTRFFAGRYGRRK